MSRLVLRTPASLKRLQPSLQHRGISGLAKSCAPFSPSCSAPTLTLTQRRTTLCRPPARAFHSSPALQSIHYWPAHVISNLYNNNKARNLFSTQRENKKVRDILRVLYDEGYIAGFSKHPEKEGFLRVHMKYDEHGYPAIHEIKSVSRPGKRVFQSVYEIRVFQRGLGTVVVGTQQGIMTVDEARRRRLGGEVLFHIS